MKTVIYILLLLIFSPQLFGQEWRDTLREARNSYKQKQYEKSFRLYRSARKLAPKEIDLADEVAQSAYKAGKYEDAEKIYAQSSSVKGSAVQKANTHRQIGNAQMKQQKYGEAIESYKESLRSNPKDEYARYNLSEAMRKQKAQQEQQQKQDQQNQKDRKDRQKQNNGQKNQDQKNQNQNQENQEKGNQQKDKPNQSSENKSPSDQKKQQGNSSQNSSGNKKNKLSDKKTERMLDKLMKQEMETKKKFEGVKSIGSNKKSGKDW